MPRTPDLFPDTVPPRKPARVLAHVADAGDCCAQFECRRCGWHSDWLTIANVTEGKRGVPCERCNDPNAPAWEAVSDNERAASHNGRHFFACRCNPSTPWEIEELSAPLRSGRVRLLHKVASNLKTAELVRALFDATAQD